jgi:hypothetical protein
MVRVTTPIMSSNPQCIPPRRPRRIARIFNKTFPFSTPITQDKMIKTSQWFTLTFEVVQKIMKDVERDESYSMRLVYIYMSDKHFVSNYLTKVGVRGRGRCGVRFIKWNETTAQSLHPKDINPMVHGSWLFARKLYDDKDIWEVFLKNERKWRLMGNCSTFTI